MSKVKLAILEDERLLARDLKMRLTAMGYDVIATLNSYEDAVDFLNDEEIEVDLMIVDIELDGQMDGIKMGTLIRDNHNFPFVYLTSHTESSIVAEARATGPSAYLIKPFREKEIQIAIDLAIGNFAQQQGQVAVSEEDNAYVINDGFFIKKKFKYEKVNVKDILFAEAQRNYTLIKTQAESYMLSLTLKTVISRLSYPYFIQSHRSYLLNLMHITGFEGNTVYLGEDEVPVSKNYRDTVFKRFQTF